MDEIIPSRPRRPLGMETAPRPPAPPDASPFRLGRHILPENVAAILAGAGGIQPSGLPSHISCEHARYILFLQKRPSLSDIALASLDSSTRALLQDLQAMDRFHSEGYRKWTVPFRGMFRIGRPSWLTPPFQSQARSQLSPHGFPSAPDHSNPSTVADSRLSDAAPRTRQQRNPEAPRRGKGYNHNINPHGRYGEGA
jgi:hypothetical protein